MEKPNLMELKRPVENELDPLTELIRKGAKKIIQEAIELEIETFIDKFRSLKTEDGKQRIIRNGYLPKRITGDVEVKVPRTRDKMAKEAI